MPNLIRCLRVLVLIGTLVPLPVLAQETFGTISGTVLDPSGAAVPGAKVVITNTDRGVVVREVETGSDGFYTVPKLVIGHYSVAVEAKGFKKATVSAIEVNVAETYRADVKMEVGSIEETMTVEASALQVESESATVGSLISGAQIRELSLNNRNYEQLVSLRAFPTAAATSSTSAPLTLPGRPTPCPSPSTASAPAPTTGPWTAPTTWTAAPISPY